MCYLRQIYYSASGFKMSGSFIGLSTFQNVTSPTSAPFDSFEVTNAASTDVVVISVSAGSLSYGGNTYTVGMSLTLPVSDFQPTNTLNGALVLNPGSGSQTQINFALNTSTGTNVTNGTEYTLMSCFVAGTMIATPSGERAIETLNAGDLVLTASGQTKPIQFRGVRKVDLTNMPQHSPVLFPAGSLGDGIPSRDLRISADHAIMAEGVLVPASSLIGGAIVQEIVTETTYYHIQLEAHDVLIANGADCETLLETDDHSQFDNGHEAVDSDAFLSPVLPRVTQGPIVDRIRAAIDARMSVTA